ncbi:MAG: peptidoglycan binding domain-containing protein [Anaerolineae bacterium]
MEGQARRNHSNRARERQMVRQRRAESTAPFKEALRGQLSGGASVGRFGNWQARISLAVRDILWYITHTRAVMSGTIIVVAVVVALFAISHLVNGRIFPNVWAAGINIGDMTVDQAAAALTSAWDDTIRIQLVDGDRRWEAKPADLGMQIDALKTAESARSVGMSGIPMGFGVNPVVSVDFTTAQNYLLDMTAKTDLAPYNAGYEWQGDQLVGVEGRSGWLLDVPSTMDTLTEKILDVVGERRLELTMAELAPEAPDPDQYLDEAQRIASRPITLNGYDPFLDQTVTWTTTKEVFASWLEASATGLTVRDETYAPYFDAQNQSLNTDPKVTPRYLDLRETREKLNQAIDNNQSVVDLRIRYRDSQYTVIPGDRAYYIARKTGIPYYLLAEANPGRNMDILSPGDVLNLPTKDKAVPLDPISNKRIVVDLDNQTLMAFENGQLKFDWLISSGMDSYPTSPGIYQILNHDPEASGGSYTLCNDQGLDCGNWTMYWFMGMYEVVPGLMNGFHGAVLLPSGAYLGGGNVGNPYTFGCVMSQNDNAKALYDWADEGTVVEVISSEYAPESQLGQMVRNQALQGA